MTTTLDTRIAAVSRTEGSRTIFGRLLAPLGGLGIVAGLASLGTVAFLGMFAWMAWIAVASLLLLVRKRDFA